MLRVKNSVHGTALSVSSRRYLFNKFRNAQKTVSKIRESTDFHHEYSIRPDTFAFKVQGGSSNKAGLSNVVLKNVNGKEADATKVDKDLNSVHPLQHGLRFKDNKSFNIVDFIYRNTTNYPFEDQSPQEVFDKYPYVSSERLMKLNQRPRKVKLLVSDFIEDSLYNPNYGYFSQEVEIFHQDKPFDYNNIKDVDDFMEHWKLAYAKYEDPKVQQVREENKKRAREFEKQSKKDDLKRKDDLLKNKKPSPPTINLPDLPKIQSVKNAQNVQKFKEHYQPKAKPTSKFAERAKKIHEDELVRTGNFAKTKNNYQLWHTPTELFLPFYGEALARYILTNYKLNHYPYNDLIIYEMGGGNGTLMCNILNYIKQQLPEIYAKTQYRIIEISLNLAAKQFQSAIQEKLVLQGLDSSKVGIINKSIFEWDTVVNDPCFFIALEVFDNFAHDLIRYDNITGEPYQGYVLVDEHGDFYEFFTPELTPYASAYLNLRENSEISSVLRRSQTGQGKLETLKSLIPGMDSNGKIHPLIQSQMKLRWKNTVLPFKDNMTPGEFIPTRLLEFFQILKHRFPNHQLLSLDFNMLPKTIPGYYNGPVVQTVLKNEMIDILTYMSLQGYFDIMFATDFDVASDLYRQVTGKHARVELHRGFMEEWADEKATRTKLGENPLYDFYTNVSFMVS